MVSMELSSCQNCCSLPPLGKLPFLKKLRICAFHAVETIGDEFYGCDSPFRSLEMLRFANMPEWNKWSFVEGIKDGAFPSLKRLYLISCPKLSGGLPISSHTITTLTIKKCGKLEIPEEPLPVLQCLHSMSISGLPKLVSFPNGGLPARNLEYLSISQCENLRSLPEQMHVLLPTLESLIVANCPEIKSFPEGGLPSNLKTLHIRRCENLWSLPEQMHVLLPTLESLIVANCPEIKSFPQGGLPSNLKTLAIGGCEELVSRWVHWDLQRLTSLESLCVGGCKDVLDSFPPDGLLPSSVTSFSILDFPQLKAQNSNAFQGLTTLDIQCCPELQCLPEESLLNS
ncbi:hypothetical protein TIFTF001_056155, partial [Ficus carica]